ncbi:ATP-grasp domain-containing protein [Pseudoalteromonas sp. S16_S37]|uniref:ATP-grasp domain-containing protein n=1 Tax=Pseudoalteromonas sp. S16_S37 TaxID=2720228 RepID=UPI00168063A6|nr:ATP-grasp domain-containing protein [Pseudoalteromonas sp. S16_S37]MBD1583308.1 ATP-grasp domain-containing protein [Pseudoalteromonas sp. S16_S37]
MASNRKTFLIFNRRRIVSELPSWLDYKHNDLVLVTASSVTNEHELESVAGQFKEVVVLDNYDSPSHEQFLYLLAKKHHVNRVLVSAEVDVLRAAKIRQKLGIFGQSLQSAIAYRDKWEMKSQLKQAGVMVASMSLVTSKHVLKQFILEYGFPAVIKPRFGGGSVGVSIVHEESDLECFIEHNSDTLTDGQWLIEAWIEGEFYTIDGLMVGGEVKHIWPSRTTANLKAVHGELLQSWMIEPTHKDFQPVCECVKQAISALAVTDTLFAFHAEVFVCPNGVVVFNEIACRPGGCGHVPVYQQAFGVNLYQVTLQAQAGLLHDIKVCSPRKMAGFIWFPPQQGILNSLPTQCDKDCVVDYQAIGSLNTYYHGAKSVSDHVAKAILQQTQDITIYDAVNEVSRWWVERTRWSEHGEDDTEFSAGVFNADNVVWLTEEAFTLHWRSYIFSGRLPLIKPTTQSRFEHWKRVLKSYHYLVKKVCDGQMHPVVYIDTSHQAIAQYYAGLAGRVVKKFASIDAIIAASDAYKSMLIIGCKNELKTKILVELSAKMQCRWGVFTGHDRAAICFLALKNRLRTAYVDGTGLIDAIHQKQADFYEPTSPVLQNYDPEKFLNETNYRKSLVVVAHGEGAHVNLNQAVLCGLYEEYEYDLSEAVLNGCVNNGEQKRCKRVHDPSITLSHFNCLKTESFLLLSCNGVSVAKEIYPSTVSSALACIEGYPRLFVSTISPIPVPWGLSFGSASLLQNGYQLPDMISALDDFIGRKELILIGDPYVDDRERTIQVNTVDLLKIKKDQIGEVIQVNGADTVIRGREHLLVTHKPDRQYEFEDKSALSQDLAVIVFQFPERLRRAIQLENTLKLSFANMDNLWLFGNCENMFAQARTALDHLSKIRSNIEVYFQALSQLVGEMLLDGLWNQNTLQIWIRIVQDVKQWDKVMCSIVNSLGGRIPTHFLGDTERVFGREPLKIITCERCQSPESVTEVNILVSQSVADIRHDCPVCGFKSYILNEQCLENLSVPKVVRGDQPVPLTFQAPMSSLFGNDKQHVFATFIDKGLGKTIGHQYWQIEPGICQLSLPLTQAISPDLHVLDIVHIGGMSITKVRKMVEGGRDV